MNTYQLRVIDETGQKSQTLTVPGETRWAEVSAIAVDRLELPTSLCDEPVFYHLFEEDSGSSLLGEQTVQEVIEEIEREFLVRVAAEMQPARHAG